MLLAFDTAGPECAVALARASTTEPTIVATRSERVLRGHAERLMPLIEAVLAEAGASYGEVDRIAVTTGPGSFTGLRVGVAAARGLALALDRPAVGVGSLEALALRVVRGGGPGTAIAVLDPGRGEQCAFAQDIASGTVVFGPQAGSALAIAASLLGSAAPFIIIGAGAPTLAAALIAAGLDKAAVRLAGDAVSPDIADVVRLGLAAEPGDPPAPFYARSADAKPQAGKALARA